MMSLRTSLAAAAAALCLSATPARAQEPQKPSPVFYQGQFTLANNSFLILNFGEGPEGLKGCTAAGAALGKTNPLILQASRCHRDLAAALPGYVDDETVKATFVTGTFGGWDGASGYMVFASHDECLQMTDYLKGQTTMPFWAKCHRPGEAQVSRTGEGPSGPQ
ncbi:MAG: hypothetical protein SFW62_03645 [Alphaproteobacteria bacterium]|nr:hypothetical protein [Alphaproteobacteria bacterium]